MARFVVEIIDQLNLSSAYASNKGYGKDPYDPRLLLGLIFYSYCTGIFSSRKIEAATNDTVAFRFIAGNLHPDHDTIANFRKTHLDKIED
ncbi:transposase [Persicobacter diffluens]|uniref:transposase n=1 Tax=Persicobacter diffluens TaxID=981 RepID=UPI0030C6718F